MKRVAIYPKDIMIITGKSERYSRDLLKMLKEKLKKEKHQVVSLQEFCTYIGLTLADIEEKMQLYKRTVFRMIDHLKKDGVPIEYCKKEKIYKIF